METKTVAIGVLMIALAGAGYYLGYQQSGERSGSVHMMGDGSMMSGDIDQHFITQMIPHHEGAIAMAKIALERSKRSEVISLARGIIEAQEKEIRDMQSWHQSWFGSAPPAGGMGMMHMDGMEGNADVLKTIAAADFDREFIDQMIPHHEMAVVMAQMLRASTERGEMRVLADNIDTSQTREIEMMRAWRAAWYGR